MTARSDDRRAAVPSMTVLLEAAARDARLRDVPRGVLADALRRTAEEARRQLSDGDGRGPGCGVPAMLDRAAELIRAGRAGRLRRVINATGIVLHTGLGRSVLASDAAARLAECVAGYCNLELDLDTGERGRRGRFAERILCRLSGAESALIVNNNAAATMLALRGLAAGREVIVSRGQLIEIGGSFRLPEIMSAGGAVLREVGTTNKTRLSDYEAAIGERTGLLMHVHTSNYRVVGFSESPGVARLVELGRARGVPVFDDLGSGALLEHPLWAAAREPTATDSLRHGADVVAFSGDKLLGGPQAGVLLGRTEFIERLRRDPMARALRVDKLTLAALEATLELYESPETVMRRVPALAALSETEHSLRGRAEALAAKLRARCSGASLTVEGETSYAGGGSLPAWPLPTVVVRWTPAGAAGVTEIARRLRTGEPAVLPRIREDAILLDLRTIAESEYDALADAVAAAVAS